MSCLKTKDVAHDILCQAAELFFSVAIQKKKPITYKDESGIKQIRMAEVLQEETKYIPQNNFQSDLLLKDIDGFVWHLEMKNTNTLSLAKLRVIKENNINVLFLDLKNVVRKNPISELEEATIMALNSATFTKI